MTLSQCTSVFSSERASPWCLCCCVLSCVKTLCLKTNTRMPAGPRERLQRQMKRRAKAARKRRAKAKMTAALLSGAKDTSLRRAPFLADLLRGEGVVGANGRLVKKSRARELLGRTVQELRAEWRKSNDAARQRKFDATPFGVWVRKLLEKDRRRRAAARRNVA